MARILIVDDEPLITVMMEDWLSELGHIVVGPAHNLAQALELAAADIDAAIVDVSLGKDNSYPLADALIERRLPFAIATGHGREGLAPKYRDQPTRRKLRGPALSQRRVDRVQSSVSAHNSRSESSFSGRAAAPLTPGGCKSAA